MDLLDRLLGHDSWTTRRLLEICANLSDAQLDHSFDIGPKTIRATFHHLIDNMEVWSSLMADQNPIIRHSDRSIPGLARRLTAAESLLKSIARSVADRNGWDDLWTDHLDKPPTQKQYGTAIAHVITHSMHHRAQILYMLKLTGISPLPEGDVFSWETQARS